MNKNAARNCVGYDPAEDLIEVTYDGQEEKELFLKVQSRMLWFHQYLGEHKAFGTVDDSEVAYLPNAKLLLVKAAVRINGETVGRACAGEYYDASIGAQDPTICQTIATQAKGRALANAGFGTADCFERQKAEDFPYPYKASSIRKCGYDPRPDLMMLADTDGVQTPYLGVKYRVQWFNKYIIETERNARLGNSYIDDSEVWYDEAARLLMARAKVFIDGKVVGSSCASIPYDPNLPSASGIVARVCTQAKGRALANAGFGVAASALEDGRSSVPCDSGIRVTRAPDGTAQTKPLYQSAPQAVNTAPATNSTSAPGTNAPAESAPPPAPAPKRGRGRKKAALEPAPQPSPAEASPDEACPAVEPNTPAPAQGEPANTTEPTAAPAAPAVDAEPALEPMPIKEALAFIMPLGAYKGSTMGEVWGKEQKIIRFYASPKFKNSRYIDIKRAALAIVANAA